MGALLSSVWVVGHSYVLHHTLDRDLRGQRYVSIFLGLSLLVSHLVLVYGATQEKRAPVILFFTISMTVIIIYWVHFAYLKYTLQDGEASKEMSDISSVLTCIYLLLILPIIFLYKALGKNTLEQHQKESV